MTVNEILNKYSKEVIIEWICNRYPVFMNKNIKKELDEIMKDCRNTTCNSNESKTVRLLGLIAEMILYRRS